MKKIAVIGASGRVGTMTVNELLRRGYNVRAIARHLDKMEDNPHLEKVTCDVYSNELAAKIKGCDTLISCFGVSVTDPNGPENYLKGAENIYNSAVTAGLDYFVMVGGAGSLYLKPGLQLVDAPQFPKTAFESVNAARNFYEDIKERRNLNWTYFSPPAAFSKTSPMEPTGNVILGADNVPFNKDGTFASITVGDLATVLVDEAVSHTHLYQRFTAANI